MSFCYSELLAYALVIQTNDRRTICNGIEKRFTTLRIRLLQQYQKRSKRSLSCVTRWGIVKMIPITQEPPSLTLHEL